MTNVILADTLPSDSFMSTSSPTFSIDTLSVKLDGYVSSLNMLSPFNILGRGYAIVQKDESVVDSVSMLNVGDEVDIKLSDGSVSAKITFVK